MMMMLLIMNMMFLFMNHPMSMGLTLILQTLMMSIISGMIMKTFWMSYILLITMLSGMLVLFIYMSSMASNEKFKTNMSMLIWFMIMMIIVSLSLFLINKMIIKNNYLGMEMSIISKEIFFLNKMFMNKNLMITIMMVMYLLLTMIVASFIVNISEGPMRMKF